MQSQSSHLEHQSPGVAAQIIMVGVTPARDVHRIYSDSGLRTKEKHEAAKQADGKIFIRNLY